MQNVSSKLSQKEQILTPSRKLSLKFFSTFAIMALGALGGIIGVIYFIFTLIEFPRINPGWKLISIVASIFTGMMILKIGLFIFQKLDREDLE